MKKVIGISSCALLCLVATSASAQQLKQSIISAGGGIAATSSMSLEWTLGEPVIEVSTSSSYTQGFHQPVTVEKKMSSLVASVNYVSVTPNPVISQLNVQVRTITEAFQLRLTDVKGTIVYLGEKTKLPLITINMSSFQNGTYLLSIIDHQGKQVETFKIIKL